MSKLVDEEALKAFRERLDERYVMEGEYSPETSVGYSDYADNLTPYSADSGVYQAIPYNFQPTGCGNGETQVDTGSYALVKEKRGNGIVYNQFTNFNYSNSNFGITFIGTHLEVDTGERGVGVLSPQNLSNSIPTGHKVLNLLVCKSGNYTGENITFGGYHTESGNNSWQNTLAIPQDTNIAGKVYASIKTTTNTATDLMFFVNSGTINVTTKIEVERYFIDLTKWFNGNIPQYLLDHPESFFRYYSGDLSYNVGETKFSNARYLTTIGRNQWDEEWEAGSISDETGENVASGNIIRSKNYIRVVPNSQYYMRCITNTHIFQYDANKNYIGYIGVTQSDTFAISPNAIFIKFRTANTYGSTYNNDITISIYYDGESGYDEYYPYVPPVIYDTGTEVLRKAGGVKDTKAPDGTITRRVGSVNLGSLTWSITTTTVSGSYRMQASLPLDAKGTPSYLKVNAICAKYELVTGNSTYTAIQGLSISINGQVVHVYDEEYNTSSSAATFKTAMSGVILYYELAIPTTEQGTPFTESVKIDDFGSMSLESANGVPQGNLIFYPVDYKAFVDTLVNYTDGDATSLAKKSDIIQELPDAPSTDGTYVLKATVSSGTVSYEWVEES